MTSASIISIIRIVITYTGQEIKEETCQNRSITEARWIYMRLCLELTKYNHEEIGKGIGKSRVTVTSAKRNRLYVATYFTKDMERLFEKCKKNLLVNFPISRKKIVGRPTSNSNQAKVIVEQNSIITLNLSVIKDLNVKITSKDSKIRRLIDKIDSKNDEIRQLKKQLKTTGEAVASLTEFIKKS